MLEEMMQFDLIYNNQLKSILIKITNESCQHYEFRFSLGNTLTHNHLMFVIPVRCV